MFSLGKRNLQRDMLALFEYLKNWYVKSEADVFKAVPENRTGNNGVKLFGCRFQLGIEEKIVTVETF